MFQGDSECSPDLCFGTITIGGPAWEWLVRVLGIFLPLCGLVHIDTVGLAQAAENAYAGRLPVSL